MQQLAVGFAREDISPLVPVHMGGYGYRSAKSVGVHDDLTLNAVALSDGAQRVVILVYDLVSFDLEGDAEIKGAVAAATDLPIDAIITNTSHTHAGPMTVHDAYQPYEPAYMGMVIQRSCLAAQVALADQQPASLSVGEAPLDIGHNRRLKAEHGVSLSSNPAGQTWHAVDVWRLQRAHDAIVLWSAPVHGVVQGSDNLYISAEWMGAARRALEAAEPSLCSVFMQGCCGDQNPYRAPDAFAQIEALGHKASRAILQALADAVPLASLPLVNRVTKVLLPLDEPNVPPDPPLIPDGPRPLRPSRTERAIPLHGLRLGDALLVGMAGEPFVEYAAYLKGHVGTKAVMVLGYTDSTLNYLPTDRAFAEGGYEPGAWIWYPGGAPWAPAIEAPLKRALTDLADDLRSLPA